MKRVDLTGCEPVGYVNQQSMANVTVFRGGREFFSVQFIGSNSTWVAIEYDVKHWCFVPDYSYTFNVQLEDQGQIAYSYWKKPLPRLHGGDLLYVSNHGGLVSWWYRITTGSDRLVPSRINEELRISLDPFTGGRIVARQSMKWRR